MINKSSTVSSGEEPALPESEPSTSELFSTSAPTVSDPTTPSDGDLPRECVAQGSITPVVANEGQVASKTLLDVAISRSRVLTRGEIFPPYH